MLESSSAKREFCNIYMYEEQMTGTCIVQSVGCIPDVSRKVGEIFCILP